MKSNEAERQLRDMRGGDDSERCGGGESVRWREMERAAISQVNKFQHHK